MKNKKIIKSNYTKLKNLLISWGTIIYSSTPRFPIRNSRHANLCLFLPKLGTSLSFVKYPTSPIIHLDRVAIWRLAFPCASWSAKNMYLKFDTGKYTRQHLKYKGTFSLCRCMQHPEEAAIDAPFILAMDSWSGPMSVHLSCFLLCSL